jgi:hypothetical protein
MKRLPVAMVKAVSKIMNTCRSTSRCLRVIATAAPVETMSAASCVA